jgi:hypothetical protein
MVFRYFIGLVVTAVVLAFTGYVSGVGFNLSLFIDVPSALVVIIFPLIFQGIMHGWKDFSSAFSVLSNKTADKKVLLKAKTFF